MKIRNKLIDIVKNNRWIYSIYYNLMSIGVNFLKFFVRPDGKTILFVVYGGKYYADSPKCLYEYMLKDDRFRKYNLIWAFVNPSDYPQVEKKVKIDTLNYFVIALKSRCWITNEGVTRALSFKAKDAFYVNTTHTTLPKHCGADADNEKTFTAKGCARFDLSCAQSRKEKELQYSMYKLSEEQIIVCGYPKNDIIANSTVQDSFKIRQKLGIDSNKKVILYAPTFREDYLQSNYKPYHVNFEKWKEILGDEYIVLYRAHHAMAQRFDCLISEDFLVDVSEYPENTDLLIASDMLISDYSGIFFEFGVQDKPMFCFAYDYDEYIKSRGLYFDIRKLIPGGELDEEHLLEYIKNGDRSEIMQKVNSFKNEYITVYGNATRTYIEEIYNHIK